MRQFKRCRLLRCTSFYFFEGDNSLIMPEIARDCRYTEYFRWRRFTGANASNRSEALMRRREFIAGVGFAAASASWPLAARAQQAKKIPVLGVLWHAENAEGEIGRVEALRRGLEEFGRVFKAQHRIEECLQRAKSEAGLADYQVRTERLIPVFLATRR